MENTYLIICLKHGSYKQRYVKFWGKDDKGYFEDLSKVQLYTLEEAMQRCRFGAIYISIDELGLTQDMLEKKHPNVRLCIENTGEIGEKIIEAVRSLDREGQLEYLEY